MLAASPTPSQHPGGARRSRAGDGLAQASSPPATAPAATRPGAGASWRRRRSWPPAGRRCGAARRRRNAQAQREHQEKEVPEGDAGEGHGARPGDRTRMLGIPVWRSRVGWGTPGPRAGGVRAASGDEGIGEDLVRPDRSRQSDSWSGLAADAGAADAAVAVGVLGQVLLVVLLGVVELRCPADVGGDGTVIRLGQRLLVTLARPPRPRPAGRRPRCTPPNGTGCQGRCPDACPCVGSWFSQNARSRSS